MIPQAMAAATLLHEAQGLLGRLDRVRPFALSVPMVSAAGAPRAHGAIEKYVAEGRRQLRDMIQAYIHWLNGPLGRLVPPAEMNRRFVFLRMRFNALLSDFDIFADVLTQRSEHGLGVLLAGLDAFAADALAIPGAFYRSPPVICYLDRGPGAAIRRARTRLPGGRENPVAIIRVPRERMVGSGIASSLVHEVGHQAANMLDLVTSLKVILKGLQRTGGAMRIAWTLWERWISEIVADLWSVAMVGISSSLGLMGVVSLPRSFVFRVALNDPHPVPWIRVKLSCAMGRALYPDPQWDSAARVWEAFYPTDGLEPAGRRLLTILESTIPSFVDILVNHRPKLLRGNSLKEALPVNERQPAKLRRLWQVWRKDAVQMRRARPALVFAVLGQAKVDGLLEADRESRMVGEFLNHWALARGLWSLVPCNQKVRPGI